MKVEVAIIIEDLEGFQKILSDINGLKEKYPLYGLTIKIEGEMNLIRSS